MKKRFLCHLILLLVIAGCSATPMNPTAKSILKENPHADILRYNNLIYINATNIESVKKSNYTKGDKIGEIKKTTTSSINFKNFYATKLATGTEIFSTGDKDKDTYTIITEVNGKQILYRVLLEG
ncbi:hypothetical protein J6TS2_43290 [Heyndrickxia sporothermodurans]|nr:hypothetical protein J6TS2_43290 [Heyndrickxia sporothermodurans]